MATKLALKRENRGPLTLTERQILMIGKGHMGNEMPFANEAAMQDAWERNRDALLAECPPGRRPWAYYRFDAPDLVFDYDTERSALYAAAILSETERDRLIASWRATYEEGLDPEFTFMASGVLEGDAARRALHAWDDIAPEVLEAWEEQRLLRG